MLQILENMKGRAVENNAVSYLNHNLEESTKIRNIGTLLHFYLGPTTTSLMNLRTVYKLVSPKSVPLEAVEPLILH